MPRIRTVKPEHWNDKQLPSISLQAHLLWIGTWNFSDDKGIFENDPLLIKSQIFPRRTDVRVDQVESWLGQLVKARYIVPFTHNGEGYFISRTFGTHQRIDKPQPSRIPDEALKSALKQVTEHSKNIPRTVEERSSLYSSVEYSSVKESSGGAGKPPPEKFFKPDLDSLKNYFTEIGLDEQTASAQAAIFFDHYESNGWKIGGRAKMKNWQAAARNWKKNMQIFKNGTHQPASTKSGTSEARINTAKNW